jgi:hypothetical protein
MKKRKAREVTHAPPLAPHQFPWPAFARTDVTPDDRPRQAPQQAASTRELGTGDCVLAMMKHFNMPMTREAYLDFAYLGEPPAELSAEQEANLPAEFQNRDAP